MKVTVCTSGTGKQLFLTNQTGEIIMKYSKLAAAVSASFALSVCAAFPAQAGSTQILVTDTASLMAALADAKAGDEIIVREGVYQNDEWTGKWAAFWSEASGTADRHIILRSEDPARPATLSGADIAHKYVLNIIGSYWEVRDLKITNAGKGIFLAKSEHSLISGCEVYDIGDEGIHIIDDSSFNTVENCWVHDTGKSEPRYGEGVYIGSAKNATDYGFNCHYNTVRRCRFGPNIAADHVDIKEFTYGNLVEYCTFDGTGMSGENGGNSFVEIKGNNAVVRYNTGYRSGAEKQLYGFDMSEQLEGWGQGTKIYDNTLYLDSSDVCTVKGWNCYAEVFRNTVEPSDCTVSGNRVMQVLRYSLAGDATGDGQLLPEDAARLRDALMTKEVPYLDGANSDLNGDGKLNAVDLTLLKRRLMQNPQDLPVISVGSVKEGAGKWRMTDGLGGRDVTFTLTAAPGSVLNMAWGYWDPAAVNESTGSTGKWNNVPVGVLTADGEGKLCLTASVPENCTRVALEIWDYSDGGGKRDPDTVTLDTVTTQ